MHKVTFVVSAFGSILTIKVPASLRFLSLIGTHQHMKVTRNAGKTCHLSWKANRHCILPLLGRHPLSSPSLRAYIQAPAHLFLMYHHGINWTGLRWQNAVWGWCWTATASLSTFEIPIIFINLVESHRARLITKHSFHYTYWPQYISCSSSFLREDCYFLYSWYKILRPTYQRASQQRYLYLWMSKNDFFTIKSIWL